MAKKWVVGLAAAITIVAVAGVGFSTFTTTAYVNGTATSATVALTVAPGDNMACYWLSNLTNYSYGSISEYAVSPMQVNLSVQNLVPGTACAASVYVNNTGTITLNLTNTLTGTGMCLPGDTDGCFEVQGVYNALDSGAGILSYNNPHLYVGTYYDNFVVSIPAGFTYAPSTMTFTSTYVGTAGV